MLKKVLIIDDDRDTLEVIEEALKYEGFDVVAVSETDDILAAVKIYSPDVLLIDYLLKGINGGELCSQVKKNSDTCNLPVIPISAYARVLHSLGDYNCNAFIPKPFDLDNLSGTINRFLPGY